MSQQHYKNHKKYYPAHHFIFLPLLSFACIFALYKAYNNETTRLQWLLFAASSFFILYLAIMLRQHYALGNQNRIVRLEFRLRYYEMFNQPATQVETKLGFGQIAALRFASNEEFKMLLNRALQENLSADEIKKAIKNWQADDMRV